MMRDGRSELERLLNSRSRSPRKVSRWGKHLTTLHRPPPLSENARLAPPSSMDSAAPEGPCHTAEPQTLMPHIKVARKKQWKHQGRASRAFILRFPLGLPPRAKHMPGDRSCKVLVGTGRGALRRGRLCEGGEMGRVALSFLGLHPRCKTLTLALAPDLATSPSEPDVQH